MSDRYQIHTGKQTAGLSVIDELLHIHSGDMMWSLNNTEMLDFPPSNSELVALIGTRIGARSLGGTRTNDVLEFGRNNDHLLSIIGSTYEHYIAPFQEKEDFQDGLRDQWRNLFTEFLRKRSNIRMLGAFVVFKTAMREDMPHGFIFPRVIIDEFAFELRDQVIKLDEPKDEIAYSILQADSEIQDNIFKGLLTSLPDYRKINMAVAQATTQPPREKLSKRQKKAERKSKRLE